MRLALTPCSKNSPGDWKKLRLPGKVMHHVCENPGCGNLDHLMYVDSQAQHLAEHRKYKTAIRNLQPILRAERKFSRTYSIRRPFELER